jgi:hypothetical protein
MEDDEYPGETSAEETTFTDPDFDDDDDWGDDDGWEDEDGDEDEDEDEDEDTLNGQWDTYAERYRCDRFDADVPEISGAEKELVESWWNEFDKVYSGRGADPVKALEMIRAFSLEHPQLVSNLGLDEEALFELEGAFNRRGDYGVFMEFLTWFRRSHFDAYSLAGTYYDCSVISYLVAHNRLEEIPEYFSLFMAYPDKDPDNLMTVVELLQMTDNRQLLVTLLQDIYPKIFYSGNVIGGESFVYPMIIEAYCSHLAPGDTKPKLDAFLASLRDISETVPHMGLRLKRDYWSEVMDETFKKTFSGDYPTMKSDIGEYYRKIRRHFTGYLLKKTGKTWHFAEYYGTLVGQYLFAQLDNRRTVRKTLAFYREVVDKFIARNFRTIIYVKELPSLAFLDAMGKFTDYLVEESLISDSVGEQNIEVCRDLYRQVYGPFSKECYAVRIFENLFE